MKWLTLDTSPNFGALYQSAEKYDGARYEIRHYVEPQTLGFGIPCARLYHGAVQIVERTGVNALSEAMSAAERHSRFVPELEFANVQEVTR